MLNPAKYIVNDYLNKQLRLVHWRVPDLVGAYSYLPLLGFLGLVGVTVYWELREKGKDERVPEGPQKDGGDKQGHP